MLVSGQRGGGDVFVMRTNPALDDRDGGSADPNQMRILPESPIMPTDWEPSVRPAFYLDENENLRIINFETWSEKRSFLQSCGSQWFNTPTNKFNTREYSHIHELAGE